MYYQMGAIESRFADMIWESEPVSTAFLVSRSEEVFNWKKSTTYTVLKRLCEKGIFINEKGTVRSLVSRDEYYSLQSERFVDDTFKGSLPAFLAAFTKRKNLTEAEVDELRRIVREWEEG